MRRVDTPSRRAPRVGVVLPAFNAAETLPAAAASLRAQTMCDWHAVIIDDGSQDQTGAVAHQIASRDDRFSVVSQPNAGVAAARNAGLARLTGAYTLLLDADDTLMPSGLEHLLAACDDGTAGASGSYGDFVLTSRTGTPLLLQRGRADLVGLPELLSSVFFAVHAVLTPTALAKRVQFDASLGVLEDTDWFLRLAESGAVWKHCREVVANYQISQSSRSADFEQMLETTRRVYGAAYQRRGLTAAGPLQILMAKATLSYVARALLRAAAAGGRPAMAEVEADLRGMLSKLGPPPALSGSVIGHLTATACTMGGCRRPRIDGTIGEAIDMWLAICCRVGVLIPGEEANAWTAITDRLGVLKEWCDRVSGSLSIVSA